jgi:5'-nucleotidase
LLEGRFELLRTQETNFGNFIADIFRSEHNSDIALVVSGGLRTNHIIEKGLITKKTIMSIFPFHDDMLVIAKITGKTLKEALENGVSKYPQYEGRFPCISGLKFLFDPEKPSNERINYEDIIT